MKNNIFPEQSGYYFFDPIQINNFDFNLIVQSKNELEKMQTYKSVYQKGFDIGRQYDTLNGFGRFSSENEMEVYIFYIAFVEARNKTNCYR